MNGRWNPDPMIDCSAHNLPCEWASGVSFSCNESLIVGFIANLERLVVEQRGGVVTGIFDVRGVEFGILQQNNPVFSPIFDEKKSQLMFIGKNKYLQGVISLNKNNDGFKNNNFDSIEIIMSISVSKFQKCQILSLKTVSSELKINLKRSKLSTIITVSIDNKETVTKPLKNISEPFQFLFLSVTVSKTEPVIIRSLYIYKKKDIKKDIMLLNEEDMIGGSLINQLNISSNITVTLGMKENLLDEMPFEGKLGVFLLFSRILNSNQRDEIQEWLTESYFDEEKCYGQFAQSCFHHCKECWTKNSSEKNSSEKNSCETDECTDCQKYELCFKDEIANLNSVLCPEYITYDKSGFIIKSKTETEIIIICDSINGYLPGQATYGPDIIKCDKKTGQWTNTTLICEQIDFNKRLTVWERLTYLHPWVKSLLSGYFIFDLKSKFIKIETVNKSDIIVEDILLGGVDVERGAGVKRIRNILTDDWIMSDSNDLIQEDIKVQPTFEWDSVFFEKNDFLTLNRTLDIPANSGLVMIGAFKQNNITTNEMTTIVSLMTSDDEWITIEYAPPGAPPGAENFAPPGGENLLIAKIHAPGSNVLSIARIRHLVNSVNRGRILFFK
eukprot:GHVL01031271.1.p1 GENE.GHVL01031271.1~~GHVL01031271.1.p1  ORF type:complete len:697 (+),score=225.14 GHVL01031271.1:255-2093(+)